MSDEEALTSGAAGPGDAEIDFEAWADLSARMLKLDQEARFDLLEEREIDPTDFMRAEQRWVMALSDDLSAEKMDRVDLYAARCAAEMQRRKEAKLEPTAVVVDVEALAPIMKALAPIEPAAVPASVPAKEAVAPFVAPPVALFTAEPPMRAAPPFVVAAPALMSSPPAVVNQAPSPPAPAAVVSMPPVIRAPLHLSGTMMASEPLAGARPASAALPFGHAPSAAFVAEMSAPRVSAPEATVGSETMPLGVDLLGSLRKELPFLKAGSAVPIRAAAPAATAAAWPRLTLDTYASLCAELSVFPERVSEILKKYGITDDAERRAVDREWAERLSSHPETQNLWQRKVGEFRAWLLRGGR